MIAAATAIVTCDCLKQLLQHSDSDCSISAPRLVSSEQKGASSPALDSGINSGTSQAEEEVVVEEEGSQGSGEESIGRHRTSESRNSHCNRKEERDNKRLTCAIPFTAYPEFTKPCVGSGTSERKGSEGRERKEKERESVSTRKRL